MLTTWISILIVDGQTNPVKIKYTLFNPVPKGEMKEMETDRPDVTESAYTVEAGHFQVECDIFKQVRNRNNGMLTIMNNYNLANFKIGLTEKMDIQLVFPLYVTNITRNINTNKIINKSAGFDDVTVRLKYNIRGSSGGRSALAVLPFVSFPTSSFSSNGVQGGIVFPFALQLKKGWDFGTQAELDINKEDDNKYHPGIAYTFTFGRTLFKRVDVFAEALTSFSFYNKKLNFFMNGGVIYSINKNFNVDAGFNYGINKDTDKIFFTGFSFRL